MAKKDEEFVGTTFEEANAPREPLEESPVPERFAPTVEAQVEEGVLPEGSWQRSITDPDVALSLTDDRRFRRYDVVDDDGVVTGDRWVQIGG